MDKSLKSKDICNIIRVCSKSHVSRIKMGDLEIEFRGSGIEKQVPVTIAEATNCEKPQNLEASYATVEEEVIEQEGVKLREEQLLQMAIEDPVEYEKLIASGDLEDMEVEQSDSG